MGSFLTNPALFIGGLIAIASPIIIHLLNKRRFKRVDWAAMDFLLEAQKLNRRKVKLEEFILLLMRCLAMGLIGFLLARPFFSTGGGAGLFNGARYERIVVLDDSLSMQAKSGGQTSMEAAKLAMEKWVNELVSGGADESLTLVLTSQPGRTVLDSQPLDGNSEAEIVDDIKNLKSTDGVGDLDGALAFVEQKIADGDASVNRVVYLLSDLRERDWAGGGESADAGVVERMKRIADSAAGCFLIDVGKEGEENLVVEEIAAVDKALVAGVTTNFEVVVRNLGNRPALDVKVRFAADESLPLDGTIDRIEPGQTGSVPFTFTFAPAIDGEGDPEPVAIRASLAATTGDALEEDDTRYFPARTVRGIQTLVVDGDPNGSFGRGETFFLRRALAPAGST
ncbi:MAG: BatA domain-containing protein, partial [Verrucomicrobiales bacterium]